MYGHIYIRHGGATIIEKANDYDTIYDALTNMGYDHEEAENIANWAEFATIGDEYLFEGSDEITLGE